METRHGAARTRAPIDGVEGRGGKRMEKKKLTLNNLTLIVPISTPEDHCRCGANQQDVIKLDSGFTTGGDHFQFKKSLFECYGYKFHFNIQEYFQHKHSFDQI